MIDEVEALLKSGDLARAAAICHGVLERDGGRRSDALRFLGVIAMRSGRPLVAAELLARSIQGNESNAAAHCDLGCVLIELGRTREALTHFDRAVELAPQLDQALNNRGTVLLNLRRPAEALASFERALAARPDYALAWGNRGEALMALARTNEALECFDRALELRPDDANLLERQGYALLVLKRAHEAVDRFERALRIRPEFPEAHCNRGGALLALQRPLEALASFERAVAQQPGNVVARAFRGAALIELRRFDEALAACDGVLAEHPNDAVALSGRAIALWRLRRDEEAAYSFERLIAVQPDFIDAQGSLFMVRMQSCDWHDYAERAARLREGVRAGRRVSQPFSFLAARDSAAEQRRCAELFVAHDCPPAAQALASREPYGHERIRVVYLSADFHHHATAYLLAELLERHDRTRFEITAISFGPPFEDDMRARLRGAVEHFFDVRELPHRAVAELLRAREIDIAIDLKGHTRDSRPQILALRPAPLQVSFLGYPATTAAPYIDYLIADEEVLPEPQRAHYSEHVVYLPDCYQCNDSRRPIAAHTPSRRELGLPERGFVFCCFNNSYKITPEVFACWMQLLREVPDSVLWLLPANPTATRNLREAARRQHVDPQRLCFCSRLPLPEHLARHRQADLFLDTLPVNAHTTASDALWAGLPVLTCRGESFVARVAASLLRSIGLPELITDSLSDYTARALYLARNPDALAALRARLAHNRLSSPLFDTPRFTRHFEAALLTLYSRHLAGLPPAPFRVRRETEATSPLLDHAGISNAAGGSPRT
jgi:predicted O-linked N-acetylglucosamine transferase (SPINDLY family)